MQVGPSVILGVCVCLLSAGQPVTAQTAASPGAGVGPAATGQNPPPQNPPPTQNPPPQNPPAQDPPPVQDPGYRETVVVSASKTEQQLVDAAATISVIGPRTLALAPSNNYADLLRAVPGVNITQISARDVNVTSRNATGSLATSQLAVVDGRSLYQDFFGFTMWDFMPADLSEIKRIEAIRGPASAVWGANALDGVVNVITKSPREMAGSSLTLGVGTFGREVDDNDADAGGLFYVRGTHAQAVNDRWAYKVSAGTYTSGALARPTGPIPGGGTDYPAYANTGTTQPKFDARVDYDFEDGRQLQFSGGIAGTEGVMHTGIGPFDIETGSVMGYWKVNFNRQALKVQAFMNILSGEATNLVSVDPAGQRIGLDFDTTTFDVEVGDTRVVRSRHVLTYGGNLRINSFDLTIAPGEDRRTEGGAYLQDEFLVNDRLRIVAGGRIDKFSSIDGAVFSPRVAAVIKPLPDQSVRVSFNRAFRAPSMVNNNLDITLATPLPLGAINPLLGSQVYLVPTRAMGDPDLQEEHLDTFEVAYTGYLRDRALVTASWYYNRFSDAIYFTQTGEWGPFSPPPGFPLPSPVWALIYASGFVFPSDFTYRNLGTVKTKGLELGLQGTLTAEVTAYVNYAFQAEPVPEFPNLTAEEALDEINRPATHLFNIGASYTGPRTFGSLSISHSTEAFWQDVLDSRFHGTTEPYTLVNLTAGMKFQDGRYTASLKVTNLANQVVQQHIFGDIMKRTVVAELRIALPR